MAGAIRNLRKLLGDEIPRYMASKSKKNLFLQISDIARATLYYRKIPYHYLTHSLYENVEDVEVLDFIPTQILHRLQSDLNPVEARPMADFKPLFGKIMREAGLPVPQDLGYVTRDGRFLTDQREPTTFQTLHQTVLAQAVGAVFIKPAAGGHGKATHLLMVAPDGFSLNDRTLSEADFLALLFGPETPADWHEFVIQKNLKQHSKLSRLHRTAVCTVRIDTLIEKDQVEFNAAGIRVGRPGGITDGWTLGGFMIPINLSNGALVGPAVVSPTNWRAYGGIHVARHPATGESFDDIIVPYWPQVVALVTKAAKALVPLKCIGWDVAITEQGPVIVEANHDYHMYLQQEAVRGLRAAPLGRLALKSLGRSGDRA